MGKPITRSLQLAAVRKDAAALTTVEAGSSRRVYTFTASDGDFDRYSDRLSVNGWRVDAYNANGVVLFNHDDGAHAAWTGAAPALPIGKGRVYTENDALMIDIEFDDDDDFAKRVERKVAKGILNAVSVRYLMLPGQYRENERGGFDCDAQELLEVSIVTIPGNARAVRSKALEDDELVERIATRVAELLGDSAEEKASSKEDDKPDAGDEPTKEPATGNGDAPADESKPNTGEPTSADAPKADDEEDGKAKGFNAREAAKGFVEAFTKHIKGV
ncbi:HK97 family phage prohead protease [Stigmatella aurantiaca]|uniref:Caudovirus prohead protease, putative n=1 Tax=Stigmatella aurantiaca (strain DW4/3-1) TaxID=378806 RepID=Q096K3_STIAD|nr:HK97 family phage prohead protease [Stigmatella aurantiaca]ADO68707.1 phage prohead protease [Stigmatella aurantiaca DW4/3-1]EAU67662.1 caudovirus prohead protease, putative [Stigmatella aurantiaca DW4/3-1]